MSKILMTADIHLGVSDRLADTVWSLRVMREYAKRNDIRKVLCLGDFFHDREALGIDVLCAAYDHCVAAKQEGQEWITFPGNHDMFLKHSWLLNSLRPFSGAMTVIDAIKILQINDVRFWILPFVHFEKAYMRVLRKIEEQRQDGDVLLTHIGTFGAVKNVCFLLKDWSVVSFHDSGFDQVYTGHFHVSQQVGRNVWYPGSPIPYKADEGDSLHGFFVYDLETRTHEFVNIWIIGAEYFPGETPPPNYLSVPDDAIDQVDESYVKNNIIRILVNRTVTPSEYNELERHLLSLGAKAVRLVNVLAESEFTKIRDNLAKSDNINVFEEWLRIDADNLEGLDVDLLRNFNSSVVADGDERYNYEEEV